MIEHTAVPVFPALPSPERRVAPVAERAEVPLFQALELRVTSERLVVQGRAWMLGEVCRVEAVRRSPRMWPLLVAMSFCGTVALPLVVMLGRWEWVAASTLDAARVLVALTFFSSLARLLLAEDTYSLVLTLPGGARSVFSSRDSQLVTRLAAAVDEALANRGHH
ncbi:hypothetical protein DRW03_07470 [Corallococcus sp. H22C18031201]|nr:hypothetical protein DRW03_07470 [Corallococcus sp. H22C18031201]